MIKIVQRSVFERGWWTGEEHCPELGLVSLQGSEVTRGVDPPRARVNNRLIRIHAKFIFVGTVQFRVRVQVILPAFLCRHGKERGGRLAKKKKKEK